MANRIIYFDGLCNLCNRFVDFLIRRDPDRRYRFASLQGKTARDRLPEALSTDQSTVVLEEGGRYRVRSDAALAILTGLGGAWQVVGILRLVPPPLRDWMYDYVARKRFRWFGRRESCRVPTADERARFLD